MKFIHLSDLHIGKSVNGFSMLSEQRHVFTQIIGYVRSERPDAVAIAGDVYDRAVPGADAVRAFDDFLTGLASEGVVVLLISGNHDSPERLSYASRLLSDKRLFLHGTLEGGARKVQLNDEYGVVNFWLMPFVKPLTARGVFGARGGGVGGSGGGVSGALAPDGQAADGGGGDGKEHDVGGGDRFEIESYGDALAAALEAADVDYSARNVLVSHQFFTKEGTVPIRSESELDPVGGLDAIDAGLVDKFDYVALGHLHGAQRVGQEHIRYAGSPLKYSFSEMRHAKSATLVELKAKGDLDIKALPLYPIHDMREIKGEIGALISDEISSLADKEDYLRVVLTDEDEIVDPMGKVRSVYPNVMVLGFENSRTRADISMAAAATAQGQGRDAALSPYDLFCEFYLDACGSAMSEEQSKIVMELMAQMESGETGDED